MERASQVGSHLHLAQGHQVPQRGDGCLRVSLLRQRGHALRDVCDGVPRNLASLAAAHQCVCVEAGAQGLVLLKAQRHLFQRLPVCATHQDARLVQPRQVVGHGAEAADEEVADGDVGAGGAAQHLLEAGQQRGVCVGVEDVHGVAYALPYCANL